MAQVILTVAVCDRRQAALHRGDLGNGFGDEILVLSRHQGQLNPRQRRNLAAPKPGGVDHPAGANVAQGGLDDPRPIGLSLGGCYRAIAVNLRPPRPCARRIGHGHARWVDIAALGFVHDAADAVEVHQRMQPFGLIPAHLIEIHPVIFRLRRLQAQLMLARLRLRKIERTRLEDAAALAGFSLQLFVKTHGIMLQTADVGAVMQPVDIGRRVPCGARGQFRPLQQNHIRPTQFGQVIQDRTADKPAADDHRLRMGFQPGGVGLGVGSGHGGSLLQAALRSP